MIKSLLTFFAQSEETRKNSVPEGLCPNCWGNQEYDNTIRELYKDHQIDVNNHQSSQNFIEKVVVGRVNGIKLKKGNSGLECPTCHAKTEM